MPPTLMPSHADPAPTSAGFVLIVEEDAAVAGRLGRSLEEHGFPVRHAADGAGAEAVLGSG
ncbi:MAG: DNA-binding response regulator, partial [Synechococcaceae bacterium WB4_1_0192]|nr:DNA-binding response regulator [Synechococcaceae bacterium WB4_1_0192]